MTLERPYNRTILIIIRKTKIKKVKERNVILLMRGNRLYLLRTRRLKNIIKILVVRIIRGLGNSKVYLIKNNLKSRRKMKEKKNRSKNNNSQKDLKRKNKGIF